MRRWVFRVVRVVVLVCAALSLACHGSGETSPMTAPTTATPPSATPTPTLGLRSVAPSAGPIIGGDYINLLGTAFESGTVVTIDGVRAAISSLRTTSIVAVTPAHALGAVDVVVRNPDGTTAIIPGGYTYAAFSVTASPGEIAPGGAVTVSFSAPSGRGCNGGGDWIAVYPVGAPNETGASNGHSDLWYDHTCGATSGTWTATAPPEPGRYEFRYMVGAGAAARSNPFDVRPAG